jgi:hypothetical protein
MKRLVLLLAIALAGCGQSITQEHLDVVAQHCESNNGIRVIEKGDSWGATMWADFRCNNGAVFNLIWKRKQ